MDNKQLIENIKMGRNLHSLIGNVLILATKLFKLEDQIRELTNGKSDTENNPASQGSPNS